MQTECVYSDTFRIFYRYNLIYLVFRRAKTPKGRRFLEAREPKLVENTKTTMFIRGGRTSETVTQALKDLVSDFQLLCEDLSNVNLN